MPPRFLLSQAINVGALKITEEPESVSFFGYKVREAGAEEEGGAEGSEEMESEGERGSVPELVHTG